MFKIPNKLVELLVKMSVKYVPRTWTPAGLGQNKKKNNNYGVT